MKDPKFCIITPTAYLEKYASQSKMHLVLAHLVDTDEQYAQFYAGRNEFKIMDNGAFELGESYAPEKLIELGRKCNADAIVLPDYPGQPGLKTIQAGEVLINEVKVAGFKTMFVPQSEKGDWEDWLQCYDYAVFNDDIDIIGMSILGIPNALPHIPKSYARVVAAQLMKQEGYTFEKYHHWLGLQNISLEVPPLIKMGVVDSLDSSNPIWAGVLGHQYQLGCDSILIPSKSNLPEVNFEQPLSKSKTVHKNIQWNIDIVDIMFDAPVETQQKATIGSKVNL